MSKDVVNSYISRWVTFLVAPLVLSGLGAGAYWLQNVTGVDMQHHVAVAATFVGTLVTGATVVLMKWVENRGLWERGEREIEKLYEAGRQEIDRQRASVGSVGGAAPSGPVGFVHTSGGAGVGTAMGPGRVTAERVEREPTTPPGARG